MSIFTRGTEKIEARGKTVAVRPVSQTRYAAVYWDSTIEFFVTVHDVDEATSVVDASNEDRLRYLAFAAKKRQVEDARLIESGDLTPAHINRLRQKLSEEQFGRVRVLLWKRDNHVPLSTFEISCLEQVTRWCNHLSEHSKPLTQKQFDALKRGENKDAYSYPRY